MELTVGVLKQIIKDLPDDVVLSELGIGNNSFHPFISVKRLLLLQGNQSWGNQQFLTINSMGSHFTDGASNHKDLQYISHWDETNINKP